MVNLRWLVRVAPALIAAGCATPRERAAIRDWEGSSRPDPGNERTSGASPPAELAEPFTVEAAVSAGLAGRPALEAARQQWRAAVEKVPQARALMDPQVEVGFMFDEVDRDAMYMGEAYRITQMLPPYGVRSARQAEALARAEAAAHRFGAERLRVAEEAAQAWAEYAFAHRSLEVARESRDLAAQLEDVVLVAYGAGRGEAGDRTRARMTHLRMEDRVKDAEDRIAATGARLNAALGRGEGASLPPPAEWPSAPTEANARTTEGNPELEAMARDVEAAGEMVRRMRRDRGPEWMVGLEYARGGADRMAMMDGGGKDTAMVMVGVSLPVWPSRTRAAVAEAEAGRAAAEGRRADRDRMLGADLEQAETALRDALRRRVLYGEDLAAQARELLASVEAAYRAGEGRHAEVVMAQQTVLDYDLALARAEADLVRARARLDRLTGRFPEGGGE